MEMGCSYLYSYEDAATGQSFMGCMNKVFKGEIDVEAFVLAELGTGFGGIKMTGEPLPQCQFTVERAYDGYGEPFDCVNPGFFEKPEREPAEFDLRNGL